MDKKEIEQRNGESAKNQRGEQTSQGEGMCIVLVNIDNYDELMESTDEGRQLELSSTIDKCVRQWGIRTEAAVTRYKDHMYLLVMTQKVLDEQERSRFNILDEIREIETDADFPVTLSIGVGAGGETPGVTDMYADQALDLALGRGGDQAVVKRGNHLAYYGGKTRTVEKGNKGKSRIIGYALGQLMRASDNVIIMGHVNPDMDSFGAAVGLYKLSIKRNPESYILVDHYNEALETIYETVRDTGNYRLINNQEALRLVRPGTLVVVVDTHRPSITECPELLQRVDRIVVIDHHRKAEEFIKDPTLAYTEPYASSTSELVAEILQYTMERKELDRLDASALLAGISVDTNRFSVKTGVRTFEAAAWLKRVGADTTDIKKFFQVGLDTVCTRARCIADAVFPMEGVAMSICKGRNSNAQIINSQAADELLTIRGIHASFVAGQNENGRTVVSARSLGDLNVQVIMEKFGGGGHMNTAGAQMDISPEEAIREVERILREMNADGEDR